jgi:secreted trypsin-like serine protease
MSSKCFILLVHAVVVSTTASSSNFIKFNRKECGNLTGTAGTVIGGTISDRHKWPWLVALYTTSDQKFFGGGSLISERFVLTAAHCLQNKRQEKPIKLRDVIVYLGRWNLTDMTEANVTASTEDFFIHPDWKPFDTRWDADIAVIKLTDDIRYSRNIRPVCLWTAKHEARKRGDGGMIVGW